MTYATWPLQRRATNNTSPDREDLPGGGIRVTTSTSAIPATESNHPEFQGQGVINNGVSITGNGVASNIGALTSLKSSELAANPSGSILGTARNNGGFRPNVIGMEHTVEIMPGNPASRTSVKAAITQGYLTSDVHGNISETASHASPASTASPAQAEQAISEHSQVEYFRGHDAEAMMNHAAHGIPESV